MPPLSGYILHRLLIRKILADDKNFKRCPPSTGFRGAGHRIVNSISLLLDGSSFVNTAFVVIQLAGMPQRLLEDILFQPMILQEKWNCDARAWNNGEIDWTQYDPMRPPDWKAATVKELRATAECFGSLWLTARISEDIDPRGFEEEQAFEP